MSIIEERWKDIKDYEGLYQVSDLGRVKSLPRNGTIKKSRILSKCYDKNGYQIVSLSKNGIHKTFKVHRLVAETFIPNIDNLSQINHKDENKQNNNVNNLEWCDVTYNINYGTRTKRSAEKHSKPICMFDTKGNYIKTYKSGVDAFEDTNISRYHISSCCNKRYGRKTAGGYVLKYESEVF